jgi:hypothetical protein
VVNHEGQAGVDREFLCDAPFFSQLFRCLSRACLDDMMMFSIKMAEKGRFFSHLCDAVGLELHRPDAVCYLLGQPN